MRDDGKEGRKGGREEGRKKGDRWIGNCEEIYSQL